MTSAKLFSLCRLGYLALLLLLCGRFIGQSIGGEHSIWFSLLWIVPLLLPLAGVLRGNPYTYAWASFILCLYLLHGLTLLYVSPDSRLFAGVEVLLLSALLAGFPFYARIRGRELGLGLKKKAKQ